MPRNVSRSPHELVTYTFDLLYPSSFGSRAGRILADRIESKAKTILSSAFQGRVFIPRPFFFVRVLFVRALALRRQLCSLRGPFSSSRGPCVHAPSLVLTPPPILFLVGARDTRARPQDAMPPPQYKNAAKKSLVVPIWKERVSKWNSAHREEIAKHSAQCKKNHNLANSLWDTTLAL